MDNMKVNFHIRDFLSDLKKTYDDNEKKMDGFMREQLKWYDDVKKTLENEFETAKNSCKQSDCSVLTRGTKGSAKSYEIRNNTRNISSDSVSARTRGALKAIRESKICPVKIYSDEDISRALRNRGQSKILEQVKLENNSTNNKRSADETHIIDTNSKKIKQEKISVNGSTKSDVEIFKKPLSRTRAKKKKESTVVTGVENETLLEETVDFNAVLHSSPKTNCMQSNTFVLSPKNLSFIPKSQQIISEIPLTCPSPKDPDLQAPSSTSTDFIHNSKAENEKSHEKLITNEIPSAKKSSVKQISVVTVKEEIITPETKPRKSSESDKRSNIENEPEPARVKRTKAKKKASNVVEQSTETARITRTKSRKIEEADSKAVPGRKSALTLFARKSLNKAKIISLQQEKPKTWKILSASVANQKLQNQIILSKLKSASKNQDLLGSLSKQKRGKEEEALIKRELALKNRQRELKEKNEMKLQSAKKQRQRLETERYNNIIQSEKEKEEKRKLLLQEREAKLREKMMVKKKIMEQKLAETEERRRLEEEARIAKLKEQEAEQQRLMLEKQKELERHEKRAQERLAEEKAREKYEMKLKEEQMMREKMLAAQMAAQIQSANKQATSNASQTKRWNYKARDENDYGLDDEETDLDSEDEERRKSIKRPIPSWAERLMSKKCSIVITLSQEEMLEYVSGCQKTPDIHRMFKMTPNKRIKRTSSAIWNTPSS